MSGRRLSQAEGAPYPPRQLRLLRGHGLTRWRRMWPQPGKQSQAVPWLRLRESFLLEMMLSWQPAQAAQAALPVRRLESLRLIRKADRQGLVLMRMMTNGRGSRLAKGPQGPHPLLHLLPLPLPLPIPFLLPLLLQLPRLLLHSFLQHRSLTQSLCLRLLMPLCPWGWASKSWTLHPRVLCHLLLSQERAPMQKLRGQQKLSRATEHSLRLK